MDGFLDLSVGGRTELRIHGVSGTPPDEMPGHPHPRQVAGDGMAGFYRDWQLMDPAVDPSPGDSARPRAYGHSNYFRDPAFTAALILPETTDRP